MTDTNPKIPGYPLKFAPWIEGHYAATLDDLRDRSGGFRAPVLRSAPEPEPVHESAPTAAPTHPLLKNFIKIGDVDVIGGRVSIVASVSHCTFAGVAALEHAVRALHKSPAGYTSAPYAGAAINDTSAGIIFQPTWGDGRYPVYAQLDKMQKVRGLFIDFEAG